MNHTLSNTMLSVGLVLSLSSCDVMLKDFSYHDFFGPSHPTMVQTGTNAAQTGFNKGIHWQAERYDSNGFPIFGYADGRPVYGYTKQGSLIYQMNHLYSGCYVPSWGSAAAYPYGVLRTGSSPL